MSRILLLCLFVICELVILQCYAVGVGTIIPTTLVISLIQLFRIKQSLAKV